MRLLFVSGTMTGGSAASTEELAHTLAARGHEVGMLATRRRRARPGLGAPARAGLAATVTGLPGRAWRVARRAAPARASEPMTRHGVVRWTSPMPERVLLEVQRSFGADVVIVNSVHRNAWRSVRAGLRDAGVPSVLYVREAATLEHIPIAALPPDLTLTNSDALSRRARELGVQATCVPSVIDLERCEIETSRETVLFVNPIASRGLAIAVQLARDNADRRFAFQLSWPLGHRDMRALLRSIAAAPNIELRDHEANPAIVYRDASVLLVPYLVDQRPRVIAEAQWNGIPVLASDLPAHREAVGAGGRFVALDASPATWTAALRGLVDDDATAREIGDAARAHAHRAAQAPEQITARFEALMRSVVAGVPAS